MDRASHLERLMVARSSGDLSLSVRRVSDADVLAASGLASASLDPLALALPALLDKPNRADIEAATRAMIKVVRGLSLRGQWRLHESGIKVVASTAVIHYLSPSCTHCRGTGWASGQGTAICTHCRGTRQRTAPERIQDQVAAAVQVLRATESRLSAAIGRRS